MLSLFVFSPNQVFQQAEPRLWKSRSCSLKPEMKWGNLGTLLTWLLRSQGLELPNWRGKASGRPNRCIRSKTEAWAQLQPVELWIVSCFLMFCSLMYLLITHISFKGIIHPKMKISRFKVLYYSSHTQSYKYNQ